MNQTIEAPLAPARCHHAKRRVLCVDAKLLGATEGAATDNARAHAIASGEDEHDEPDHEAHNKLLNNAFGHSACSGGRATF